jgi:hypothetical protein
LLPVVDAGEPAGDMADWRNWELGDLVLRIVLSPESEMPLNMPMQITEIDDSEDGQNVKIAGKYWPRNINLKFHSRPKPC